MHSDFCFLALMRILIVMTPFFCLVDDNNAS